MGGCCAVNGTRRDAVGRLSGCDREAAGGVRPSAEDAGQGPIAENLGQLRVKLGERGAERALARWVGARAEVTGDGERGVPKDISDAEASSHFAIRLLSRSSGSAAVALRAARDGMVAAHRPAGRSFPSVEGRLVNLPGVQG
jgi:hypothetical protein